MAERPDFQQTQYAFAAHIRDPEHNPAPVGIEDRRMAIYRRLFFNNLLSLLSSTFPVLKKIHSREDWQRLIRQFMIHHRAETPYFLEIPREFLAFLQSDYPGSGQAYPFINELAHYEWVELDLSVSTRQNDLSLVNADGDLLTGVPVKSVLACLLAYSYPVHRISAGYLPDEPGEQPTWLCVYRKQDDELGFMELNPVTARLLQLIEANDAGRTGGELLGDLASEIGYDADSLLLHGSDALEGMRRQEILLGTRKSPDTTD